MLKLKDKNGNVFISRKELSFTTPKLPDDDKIPKRGRPKGSKNKKVEKNENKD